MELPRPFAFPLHPPALAERERRLGGYELLDELATGRTFRLDLAVAPNGQAVALKRLRGESAIASARLEREARVAGALDAPNLLRAYELLQQPEPTLALEYVHGLTLRQLLASAQPSDLRHAVTALLGALHGLAALHAHRLVHQAPVARHVLVGSDGVARLIDLSHLRGDALGDTQGAEQGLVLSELAPEQIQARHALDPRCDVFIAGATLRELIARCRLPGSPLDEVWRRATATRREERYLSANELGYALERASQRAGLIASADELASWVRLKLQDERSSARPAPPARRSEPSAPVEPAWVEHAEAWVEEPTREEPPHTSFVPPRVSLPRVQPSAERMSSVWYAVEAKATDDDVVRAIAAAKPLRAGRKADLRALGSGAAMCALALCGLVAMGASSQEQEPAHASPVRAASVAPAVAPAVVPPPPPVPAVTPMVVREEPWQRSESLARRAEPRSKRHHVKRDRQLVRMVGSVPDNPF